MNSEDQSDSVRSEQRLGKRRWRLVAVLIDGVIGVATSLPVLAYFDVWRMAQEGQQVPVHVVLMLALWGWAMFVLLNFRLLSRRGQTIGKWCVDLAIVGVNGERKSALHLLTRRFLPISIVGLIPLIGHLLITVDTLFIFGRDKRCVHDRLADTKVIDIVK